MAGKAYVKGSNKKKEVLNRKLTRSRKFKVGKCKGKIVEIKFVTMKNQKEAVSMKILNETEKIIGEFLIFHNTDRGMKIIDTILDFFDEDEIELEDLKGLLIEFETELNGDFLNLKSVLSIEEDIEDDEEDVLDDEVEGELEEEED